MRSDIVRQARRLSSRGYTVEQIALATNMTTPQVEYALADTLKEEAPVKEGSPDELIDGEKMSDRIERMKKEYWDRHLDEMSSSGQRSYGRDYEPRRIAKKRYCRGSTDDRI